MDMEELYKYLYCNNSQIACLIPIAAATDGIRTSDYLYQFIEEHTVDEINKVFGTIITSDKDDELGSTDRVNAIADSLLFVFGEYSNGILIHLQVAPRNGINSVSWSSYREHFIYIKNLDELFLAVKKVIDMEN